MLLRLPLLATVVALVTPSGFAQGSDLCGFAQPISGDGTWFFDTTLASTDGLPDPLCDEFTEDDIEDDVWFAWTATLDGTATLSTCGTTTMDTRLAVYAGVACGTSPILACVDDTCLLQTELSFSITSGSTYLVRLGNYPTADPGTGTFDVTQVAAPLGCVVPAPGPDLCVADLGDVRNWGAVGGIAAYSVGTTVSNLGDAVAVWSGTTASHPVVAQNLYRFEGGRFEHLGMSWVQHAKTATNGTFNCVCVDPGSSSLLGAGCAEVTSGTDNGDQAGVAGAGGLGPRSQVDPFTGQFPFPHAGLGTTGGLVERRLQVATADLDPALHPGARYFIEAHTVSEDEAVAGNHFDNASYREVLIGAFQASTGSYELIPTGPTRLTIPAIRAWATIDPAVQIEELRLANEGQFLIASRATDNGDGTWHYEYAAYNHNSQRAGSSFSVPTQPGVNVTGTGSRTVDHHSGEGLDTGLWATSVLSDRVLWATDDFQFNPNANALRWGTVFNYRFDANASPVAGSIELGLFRGPGVRSVNAVVPGTPIAPPPPLNDSCANPSALFGTGTFAYDTTSASTSGFDGGGGCGLFVTNDVFFEWTALVSGDYVLDTCGSSYDTRLAIHGGLQTDCSALCLAEDDDDCDLQSRVVLIGVTAGDTFLVQVGGFNGQNGPASLNVGIAPQFPSNDDCFSAAPIQGEVLLAWNNLLASTSGFDGGSPAFCMSPLNPDNTTFGQTHQDLFWAWTPGCSGDWLVSTDGSPGVKDTRLSVHQGPDCSATCLGSNDDIGGGNFYSEWTIFGAEPTDSYLIQVGVWVSSSTSGEGVLSITRNQGACPQGSFRVLCDPANDHEGGVPARLDTSSFGSGVGSGLHLEATDGPPSQFGFVLLSASNTPGANVFNGVLCLGSPAARYTVQVATNQGIPGLNSIGQFDAQGVLVNLAGTSSTGTGFDVPLELPFTPAGQTIQPGDVFSFQVWFRDSVLSPGDSANFTNLIEVTFP